MCCRDDSFRFSNVFDVMMKYLLFCLFTLIYDMMTNAKPGYMMIPIVAWIEEYGQHGMFIPESSLFYEYLFSVYMVAGMCVNTICTVFVSTHVVCISLSVLSEGMHVRVCVHGCCCSQHECENWG